MSDHRVDIQPWEALNYVPIGVVLLRADFTVVHWNMCVEEWTGVNSTEMMGRNVVARFPGFGRPDVVHRIKPVFHGGPPVVLSSQLHRCVIPRRDKENPFQEIMVTGVPATDGDGFYAMFAIQDVTDLTTRVRGYWEINRQLEREATKRMVEIAERKRATAALRESEGRLRAILNTAGDGIITIDQQGIINSVNPATEQLFGYTRNELIGRNISMLMPPPHCERHDDYIASYRETGTARIIGIGREMNAKRKDGSTFPVDLAVSEVKHLGLFAGIVRDISERKEVQEALRREHELSESIIHTAQIIILVLDPQGRVVRFNPYMEELSGWRLDEARGLDWSETFLSEHDRATARELFQRAITKEKTRGHTGVILTKDGRERVIEWYVAPLTNAEGELVGLLCTGQDMTERRILEGKILDISDQEQRRIGSDLHDGVCQELTGLGMLAQGLADRLANEEVAHFMAERGWPDLRGVSQRLSAGLGQATEHARALSHGLIPVDVDAQGLMAALSELVSSMRAMHEVCCVFEHDGPVELFDNFTATHLYRIAQEAVGNALRHGQAKRIRVTLSELGEDVVLEVADDGVGMSGTMSQCGGMGLRIMQHRADLIGARFNVCSKPGGGTTVTCHCPKKRANHAE
jgi:PAS domain S-box-containing protein